MIGPEEVSAAYILNSITATIFFLQEQPTNEGIVFPRHVLKRIRVDFAASKVRYASALDNSLDGAQGDASALTCHSGTKQTAAVFYPCTSVF